MEFGGDRGHISQHDLERVGAQIVHLVGHVGHEALNLLNEAMLPLCVEIGIGSTWDTRLRVAHHALGHSTAGSCPFNWATIAAAPALPSGASSAPTAEPIAACTGGTADRGSPARAAAARILLVELEPLLRQRGFALRPLRSCMVNCLASAAHRAALAFEFAISLGSGSAAAGCVPPPHPGNR